MIPGTPPLHARLLAYQISEQIASFLGSSLNIPANNLPRVGEQMLPDAEPPFVVATYDEIRLRFRFASTDAARMRAKRRKWAQEPRNDPGAVARVRVPRDEWDAVAIGERSRGAVPHDPEHIPEHNALADAVAVLREGHDRLVLERDAAVVELSKLRERMDTTTAKLSADIADLRLQAAVAEAKREAAEAALAEARRPFWRRWLG